MFDVRPVFYVIGLLVAALGATMLAPFALDLWVGNGHAGVFLQSALLTVLVGTATALATRNAAGRGLTIQQTFLLTTSVWVALPIFGALPFVLGATDAGYTDAFFEAMSGLTTTGATVLTGLGALPEGLLLWRAILQWLGGVGIIVVAMVFLPELRVGGMQIFRSEGFDTLGKILPRATEIASRISVIYVGLTFACILGYLGAGMEPFDAILHALTTISTGGFSTRDASFGAFAGAPEYVAVLFMLLAALPFVRFVQLMNGQAGPLWRDPQVRGLIWVALAVTALLTLWRWGTTGGPGEEGLRQALFNTVSILTGTGYASTDYGQWGAFVVVTMFFVGLIGGCAGSTSCSVKIFRYQLLFASVSAQLARVYSPSGVFTPRYQGRPVAPDVINSVMSFFVLFVVSLAVFAILLSMTGLDLITSVSGAAAALANIGPGLGPTIGPSGTFAPLPDTAKWLLCAAMILGRLELLAVFALFSRTFWRP
ncbi:MAG: TrkH family potassium uptake protein [Shimia sp.]